MNSPTPEFVDRELIGGSRYDISLNSGEWWEQLLGMGSVTVTPNYVATREDKEIAKALLNGWSRSDTGTGTGETWSDRYLDFHLIKQIHRDDSFTDLDDAFGQIRKNKADGGAVSFLYNEIPAERTLPALFGDGIERSLSYNEFYSRLILWDQYHCFGLVAEIKRRIDLFALGGGSAENLVYQAASAWIYYNQQHATRSVYHAVALA